MGKDYRARMKLMRLPDWLEISGNYIFLIIFKIMPLHHFIFTMFKQCSDRLSLTDK